MLFKPFLHTNLEYVDKCVHIQSIEKETKVCNTFFRLNKNKKKQIQLFIFHLLHTIQPF